MLAKARTVSLAAALLAAVLLPATSALAQSDANYNVRVTFTAGKLDGAAKKENKVPAKSLSLVVTSGGPPASLLTGSRVPIPKTTIETTADGVVPVTSYTYQNIGFSAQVEATILPNGWIQVRADLEDSWIEDGPENDADQPVVETRNQQINVILQEGTPIEIVRSTDADDRIRWVDVEAEILD
jgi:hypothetical protein